MQGPVTDKVDRYPVQEGKSCVCAFGASGVGELRSKAFFLHANGLFCNGVRKIARGKKFWSERQERGECPGPCRDVFVPEYALIQRAVKPPPSGGGYKAHLNWNFDFPAFVC